ncbi:MAG: M14 family metallopeptidase [Candidatus Aminicenantes bacterium]
MRKHVFYVCVCLLICFHPVAADLTSFSQVFQLKKGLLDQDGDGLADSIALSVIIPDNPTAEELAVASDIAARANLESLVVDFELVRKESVSGNDGEKRIPILIGTNLRRVKSLIQKGKLNATNMNHDQGIVALLSENGQYQIVVAAGSQETLLKTGRAFFLRWPYLWDIWGRDEGDTYLSLENDLKHFLKSAGSESQDIAIVTAAYEFPVFKSPHEAIQRLRFNSGEIKDLSVRIEFPNQNQMERAHQALQSLLQSQKKGERTEVLNYSGCRQMTIELRYGEEQLHLRIRRAGFPKRILTPSYKSPVRSRTPGKNFDLLSLLTPKGLYSDRDRDNHADGVDTRIIIPPGEMDMGTEKLASRLVLGSAGASFPLVQLDTEIENPKNLLAPILIGENNRFNRELLKTAKLKIPTLEKGWGLVTVVPQALNKSNALVVTGADRMGMENTLDYLSRTFPYLSEYREGEQHIQDVSSLIEKFFSGDHGAAEAFFSLQIEKTTDDIQDKDFESVSVELFLPQKNPGFEQALQNNLKETLQPETFQFKSFVLKDNKPIFEKEKDLIWEKDEALKKIQDSIGQLKGSTQPVRISVGVSESPAVREVFKEEIEQLLQSKGIPDFEVEVLSAYKQGFFWLTERVIPSLRGLAADRLLIRFAEEVDDLSLPKRFYSEPCRWLQELYPVDEIIARDTQIPLEKIEFELKSQSSPVYEVLAFGKDNQVLFQETFSPRIREDFYLKILPEWGKVKVTTGWVTIHKGKSPILDIPLKTDMERFWDFYQEEILPEVYSYIQKKTGNAPAFAKQPYFKRLLIKLQLSEPDYRLGLDEEIISSLESIHDEIYFDTLDFLRGITEIELEDERLAEDSSRYSAPGNILPLIHPSLEGKGGKVQVKFEDWQAESPQLILKWKERNRIEHTKQFVFPALKMENMRVPTLIFNGEENQIEQLFIEIGFTKELEYTSLIDIIEQLRILQEKDILKPSFSLPRLKALVLILKYKDLVKEEKFPVRCHNKNEPAHTEGILSEAAITPTDKIISPQHCLEIVERLSRLDKIQAYTAGRSYENREIPVLEIFSPLEKYTSIPRLITSRPTLYISGRQHANEVSATNYILKFAELLATDERYKEYITKMNFVLHPLENPDGAKLAYQLQELTPFHSLHAGRYTSLGIDVGYQVSSSKPLLPEAKVRGTLYNKWLPDIYLNLHGYPSHEWVQQFSNYSPYLFRDYWIPRGGFVYYRSLSLPIYEKWKRAGTELKETLIEAMTADHEIKESNKKFYDRYFRWAARWQPHMNYLEIDNGLNLYAKRRSSRASRLSSRRQLTFVEETPELMDETAHGSWLEFLVRQGLAYLMAHVKYLSQTEFEIVRIEEESRERISIQFVRSRPGTLKKERQ